METCVAVKCVVCGKLHEVGSESYVAVHGNITVGHEGGVIGDNFDRDGRCINATVFCRTLVCLGDLINQLPLNKDYGKGDLPDWEDTE